MLNKVKIWGNSNERSNDICLIQSEFCEITVASPKYV